MGPVQKENSQQAGTNQDQQEEELARNLLKKFMPRRSIWKGSFLDAFLLKKFFFYSPTPDEFEASGAFFEDFLLRPYL